MSQNRPLLKKTFMQIQRQKDKNPITVSISKQFHYLLFNCLVQLEIDKAMFGKVILLRALLQYN